MRVQRFSRVGTALMVVALACSAAAENGSTNATPSYERVATEIATARGWLTNLTRGREIIRELSALTPEELGKLKISAYRGDQVAFVGDTAPPGGTEDLLTESGFYLRVVNLKGKELRPCDSMWCEVMVHGKILQVLPKNRILVIEVDAKQVIQTG